MDYFQKTETTPSPAIAIPPATREVMPRPLPNPAIAAPAMIVIPSPIRLRRLTMTPKLLSNLVFKTLLYDGRNFINVELL